jgi:hypothetical protein
MPKDFYGRLKIGGHISFPFTKKMTTSVLVCPKCCHGQSEEVTGTNLTEYHEAEMRNIQEKIWSAGGNTGVGSEGKSERWQT